MGALLTACALFENRQGDPAGNHGIMCAATYRVAPVVKGRVLDEAVAVEWIEGAMADHDTCREPNPGEVLSALRGAVVKVEAWTEPGSEFPVLPPEPSIKPATMLRATPFAWTDPAAIPPREWLYGGHSICRYVTATVAPDMVTGRGLLSGAATTRKLRVGIGTAKTR